MELDQFKLLFGEKGELFCKRMFSLQKRFPRLFPKILLKEMGNFLSACSDSFLDIHNLYILSRILFSHHRLIERALSSEQRICTKILEVNSSVYGISIALSSLQENEKFNEKHILNGIQNLIPGIKVIPFSYLAHHRKKIHLFYIEIKKMRGGVFSEEEREKLNKELDSELQKRIENTSRALFFPGNEEELFKNVKNLSQELKFVDDLPQVMITFTEYFQDTLKFLVIVLRIVKTTTPSILSLSAQLPSLVRFSLENIFEINKLRKKYPKEAAIFTLEIDSSLFARSSNAVNLRTARQYIVKSLETMIGPFRDYNGGLLNKENEQLTAIKNILEKNGAASSFLEDFFYGIKPIGMRATLSAETGISFAALFQKIKERRLEKDQKYCLEKECTPKVHLAIIKTHTKEWKHSLSQRIQAASSQIGFSYLEQDGSFYLCFFHEYPQVSVLFDAIEHELAQCQSFAKDQKRSILTINFQGGDPPSLNPRFAADIHCHILSNLLFEGLTSINEFGQVEPAAAKEIEISPCRTQYIFHLRNAWWSNGEEVTAYHFERTWKKVLMSSAPSQIYSSFFSTIKNAKKAREKILPLDQVGIIAKNAKTLQVELESPCSYFLNLVASPPFFPMSGEYEEPINFNGPFALADWKRDSWIYLSQNPFYHNASRVKLGGIKILMVRDPYAAYEMFKKKELDVIGDPISPLPLEILRYRKIQNELNSKSVSRIFWIHCNLNVFPLNNVNLRLALNLALNRKELTEKAFFNQVPHFSPLPPKYCSYEGSLEGNPDLAREYFEKALHELKIDRNKFAPLVITHSDLSFEKPHVEELQTQWGEVLGISVLSQMLPWNEFSLALERGKFQLGGLFRRDYFNSPMYYLSFFRDTPYNPHGWKNEEYEKLFNLLYQEEDQRENLKKIERLLIDEAPVIPLVNQQYQVLINKRIGGVRWKENGCVDFSEAWIDEGVD